MLRQTLHWVLTSATFRQSMVDMLLFLKEAGRSIIEVKKGKFICVVDMLCTMYQPVTMYDRLEVVEKVLEASVKGDNNPRLTAKFKHIVNRRMCLPGEDLPHTSE